MSDSGYIVNPIWFWLISIVDKFGTAASIIAGFLFFAVALLTVVVLYNYSEEQYENIKKIKPHLIKTFAAFVIVIIITVLTPSRQDMEKIIVFSTLTKDNITAATNYGKDLVDYVFDKINETTKENE